MATEHERRIMWNIRNKPAIRQLPQFVDVNICLGGQFKMLNGVSEYCGGTVYKKLCVWLKSLDVCSLRVEVEDAMKLVYNGTVCENFSIWYKFKNGDGVYQTKVIESHDDIVTLIEGRDICERVCVYVEEFWDIPRSRKGGPKLKGPAVLKPKVKTEKVESQPKPLKILSPTRRSPRLDYGPDVFILTSDPFEQTHPQTHHKPFKQPAKVPPKSKQTPKSTPTIQETCETSQKTPPPKRKTKPPPKSKQTPEKSPPKTPSAKTPSAASEAATGQQIIRSSPRFKQVARRHACTPVKKPAKSSKGKLKKKAKGKGKACNDELLESDGNWSSDSDHSDLDVDFNPEEEDFKEGENTERDEFVQFNPQEITKLVLGAFKQRKSARNTKAQDVETEPELHEEVSYDSEDLESLKGSDEEVDPYPHFNTKTDFGKKISLVKGLKFKDKETLRKALRYHAVQGHYDYYYLHNTSSRITIYCRHKCSCPWDNKRSKIVRCQCEDEYKCHFMVHAMKLKMEQTFQIKSLNTEHTCGYQDANPKLTSEYLADKYLDLFRENPTLNLRMFRKQVQIDIGVVIGYYKAWFARCRAKFLLYGDAALQYGKVYDYAFAVMQTNPGSTCIVSCDGVETGTPVFKRFYMCLSACKKGFKGGCRPILGVDGCHLKGEYPGMILTAVSKDGNNNIFPLAWAVVEVENKDSWTWFLNLLMDDVEHPEGEGLTIMSDRQKGLVDAIASIAPKAEVRYCVRHIWSNFKLQFDGQAFKEHFWHAARTSNKNNFETGMYIIKELDEDAYNFLAEIPEKHWARHAFESRCKSNMLLNNLCETFNSVIREARDKPIITCIDWIRRYTMRRMCEKLAGVSKHKNKLMPYISKVFEWVSKEAMNCALLQSSVDEWEVEHEDDKHVVNLKERTCSCYKWELTGIPCPHAFACITKRRESPNNFVDEYYTKNTYIEAYKENIKPMPGMDHWDKTDLPSPLPPPMRKMPGRPSKKKRKRQVGEDGEEKFVKRAKKQNCCSNCGQPGHYKTKCKNPPAPPKEKGKSGRPPSTDPWSVNRRLKKQARAVAMQYPEGSSLTTAAPSTSTHTPQATNMSPFEDFIPSQASSAPAPPLSQTRSAPTPQVNPGHRLSRTPKLYVKSVAKKQA